MISHVFQNNIYETVIPQQRKLKLEAFHTSFHLLGSELEITVGEDLSRTLFPIRM